MSLVTVLAALGGLLLFSPGLLVLYAMLTESDAEHRTALPSSYSPAANRPRPSELPGRCPECGAENDSEYAYCRECGAELEGEAHHGSRSFERSFAA